MVWGGSSGASEDGGRSSTAGGRSMTAGSPSGSPCTAGTSAARCPGSGTGRRAGPRSPGSSSTFRRRGRPPDRALGSARRPPRDRGDRRRELTSPIRSGGLNWASTSRTGDPLGREAVSQAAPTSRTGTNASARRPRGRASRPRRRPKRSASATRRIRTTSPGEPGRTARSAATRQPADLHDRTISMQLRSARPRRVPRHLEDQPGRLARGETPTTCEAPAISTVRRYRRARPSCGARRRGCCGRARRR